MRYFFKSLPEEENFREFLREMRFRRLNVPCETRFFDVSDCMVGYCVRIFPVPKERNYHLDDFQYHADCILPNGRLAGYGYDRVASLEHVGNWRDKYQKGLEGQVLLDKDNEPKFFDASSAMLNRCLTTFLLFSVSRIQAQKFLQFWNGPTRTYNKLLNNCSSVPYKAFNESGIFPKVLAPPITPQRLYNHLKDYLLIKCPNSFLESAGFLGLDFMKSKLEVRIPKRIR